MIKINAKGNFLIWHISPKIATKVDNNNFSLLLDKI